MGHRWPGAGFASTTSVGGTKEDRVRRWLAGALALGLVGCGGVEVRSDLRSSKKPEVFEMDTWCWGLFTDEVDVGPEAIARIEVDDTLKDKLFKFMTGGFYAPTHVKVWFVEEPYEPYRRREADEDERLTK